MSEERKAVLGGSTGGVPTGRAATRPAIQLLPPNPVFRFYKGGAGIDAFRGSGADNGRPAPEDWVASTTTSFGSDTEGLATLADGRLLRDAIEADPVGYLGQEHAERYGANPAVLVKLLDTGERLAVHFHPGRGFARDHLQSDFGKTEAWLILEAQPGAHMHLGLRSDIDRATLERWLAEQDSEVMLAALNRVPVRAGDALLVPAGTLHTIGAGITLIELQEPSDMSVVVEWSHAGIDAKEATLGLGWDTVLPAAELAATTPIRVPAAELRPTTPIRVPASELQPTTPTRAAAAAPDDPGATAPRPLRRMLPPAADAYFGAEMLTVHDASTLELDPQFSILIAAAGELAVAGEAQEPITLTRGAAALIPHAAGRTSVSGSGSAIRCLPPSLSIDPGAGGW